MELQNKNILHRDIKAKNVLYSNGIPILCDFGLCIFGNPNVPGQFRNFMNAGTIVHMAPEAFFLGGSITTKVDIFAVGPLFF